MSAHKGKLKVETIVVLTSIHVLAWTQTRGNSDRPSLVQLISFIITGKVSTNDLERVAMSGFNGGSFDYLWEHLEHNEDIVRICQQDVPKLLLKALNDY